MTTPIEDAYQELSELITADGHNELECRKYISLAKELLVPYTATTTILHEEEEYRGHTGDSDLIVFCEHSSGGVNNKQAYVWEIKAPQCYLFQRCNDNRVKPTADFIKAENQLLHYYEECKNLSFTSEFEITHPENIKLGGILIGNRDTLVNGDYDTPTKFRLYRRALYLRQQYLYGHSNIKVMIWNEILDYLKTATPVTLTESGDIGSISLTEGSEGKIINSGDSF